MSTFDTMPGESNPQIISSIINLVCPQCGGPMSEFQCEGRCRGDLAPITFAISSRWMGLDFIRQHDLDRWRFVLPFRWFFGLVVTVER